jgi:hypothetical protein
MTNESQNDKNKQIKGNQGDNVDNVDKKIYVNKLNLSLPNRGLPIPNRIPTSKPLSTPMASNRTLDTQFNLIDSQELNMDSNMKMNSNSQNGNENRKMSTNVDIVDNVDKRVSSVFSDSLPDDLKVSILREPEYSGVHRFGPNESKIEEIRAQLGKGRLIDRVRGRVDPGKGSMPSRDSPSHLARVGTTLSQGTLEMYLKRGRSLFDRYCREMDITAPTDEVSPVDFVNWTLALKITLKSSSWRLYRQSAYHFIQGFPANDVNIALAMLDNDIMERSSQVQELKANRVKHPKRSSGLKEKKFPLKDYERITTALRTFKRSKLAPITADWIQAGLLTALRPIEWRGTDLEVKDDPKAPRGRRAWLYVINAKATNGRGTGVARTLDISNFSNDDLQVIERMVKMATDWLDEDRYYTVQNECSQILKNLMNKMYPNKKQKYSLYSCRHQAIANWKSIMTLEEIAALVGHSVTNTSVENYGRRSSAWDTENIPLPPRPIPEELAKIRTVINIFEHKTNMEIKAGIRKPNDIPRLSLFDD